ncbi:MAG: carbohydrate binding domain-containing protein [Phycisphaerales bacterium]
MKLGYFVNSVILIMAICGLSQAADLLIEDFESYADTTALTSVWKERNPDVETMSLETTESYDGTKSMIIDYNCHASPYWSEAYTIYSGLQDWDKYKTMKVWLKGYIGDVPGREPNQSNENMYAVFYTPKPGIVIPVDQSEMDMIGKANIFRATKIADWTVLHFCLTANFEPMTKICAFGIGMSPDSYGRGIVKIDAITLSEESYGGVINSFDDYADTAALRNALDVNEGNSVSSSMTLVTAAEDGNALNGKTLKFDFNNGMSPYWAKVAFNFPLYIKYAWGPPTFALGGNYNPLTINFKVVNADSRIQAVLVGTDGTNKVVFHYPDEETGPTYRVPEGDWIRWDINPQSVYERAGTSYDELDSLKRLEIQFVGGDNGVGVVYMDDIHVNFCGQGLDGTLAGALQADLNHDCVVDFSDIALFAEHWRQTGCTEPTNCGGADISYRGVRTGKVGFEDLLMTAYRWLDCNYFYQQDCF